MNTTITLVMYMLMVSIKLSFPHVFSGNPMSKPFMDARLRHSGMTKY